MTAEIKAGFINCFWVGHGFSRAADALIRSGFTRRGAWQDSCHTISETSPCYSFSFFLTTRLGATLAVVLALLSGMVFAQAPGSGTGQTPSQPAEQTAGGYAIHPTIDLGYRFADTTGNGGMYDTLVNLHAGPRILDQTLSMQSLTHESLLFDNLFVSSFGWGGDPSNVFRARADKHKWYNFAASFRRDLNFFDYNLLANPLNPPSSTPNVPVVDSPHAFRTTRRMTDVDLVLLPQSRFSIRLGYSHNNMAGPSFSSVHEGTDAALFQPWNTTLNSWRIGADWRFAPRTAISFDQYLNYFKGDTNWQLAPFVSALLPGVTPPTTVELGLPFNTKANTPCAVPTGQTSLINSSGNLTNLACNAYFLYARAQRVRTSMPTERLSLRSEYFHRLDLTASYSYSWANMDTPLAESFNGLISRTGTRKFSGTGAAHATQVSNVADVGATFHISKHLRLIDTFYFWAYHMPENFAASEIDNNIPGITNANPCRPPSCSLVTPPSGTVAVTVPTLDNLSFNQNLKRNQTELAWDLSKTFGARVGFRYGHRVFTHFLDFTGDVDQFPINEYTTLLGFWVRPAPNLRLNLDLEHGNYDENITRISPRKEGRYRAQANYTPRPWAILGASVNIWQSSNRDSLVNFGGHNRNYGFSASLAPRERYGLDLAYNYNDVRQNALICFNDTPPTGVVLPVVASAASCAALDANNPLLNQAFYENRNHFGMATLMFKPVKRVTTQLGYSITSVGGSAPVFNFLQPDAVLHYNYHQPVAQLGIDLGHHITWNTGWNYYQYKEKTFVGPTEPRYFHANTASLSLLYAF
jgi:hypothetical protein